MLATRQARLDILVSGCSENAKIDGLMFLCFVASRVCLFSCHSDRSFHNETISEHFDQHDEVLIDDTTY